MFILNLLPPCPLSLSIFLIPKKKTRELDEEDKRKLSREKNKKQTRVGAMVKMAKDLATMAEVAYADNEVKKKAEEDASTILENIMTGKLAKSLQAMSSEESKGVRSGAIDDVALVEILAGYIAPPVKGEKKLKLEEMKTPSEPLSPPPPPSLPPPPPPAISNNNSTSNNSGGNPQGNNNANQSAGVGSSGGSSSNNNNAAATNTSVDMDLTNRSDQYSFEIDSLGEALRYLQEGVEFTKTTYFGSYRYSLWLNATTPRLEWQKLGSLTKNNVSTRHSLVLDNTVHFVTPSNNAKERKLYLRSASVNQDIVFEFPRAEAASQFKKCLEIVLTQYQDPEANPAAAASLQSPLLYKSSF
jgi:hypothetical protein